MSSARKGEVKSYERKGCGEQDSGKGKHPSRVTRWSLTVPEKPEKPRGYSTMVLVKSLLRSLQNKIVRGDKNCSIRDCHMRIIARLAQFYINDVETKQRLKNMGGNRLEEEDAAEDGDDEGGDHVVQSDKPEPKKVRRRRLRVIGDE